MKVQMDFTASNHVWNLIELPNVNDFLKQRKTHKATLRDIRQDLLPKDSLKKKELTTQRHFLLYERKSNYGEHLVCKLDKSIYGLKQASYQWPLLHLVLKKTSWIIVSESKICFLLLHVDDILLATNNKGLLYRGETSYVISIKIHRERSRGILGLSQENYINTVLEIFNMKDCSPSITPIMKGDKLNLS
ncbi:hypothetical protein CR513_28682, partial [Mucuna pruriens]